MLCDCLPCRVDHEGKQQQLYEKALKLLTLAIVSVRKTETELMYYVFQNNFGMGAVPDYQDLHRKVQAHSGNAKRFRKSSFLLALFLSTGVCACKKPHAYYDQRIPLW